MLSLNFGYGDVLLSVGFSFFFFFLNANKERGGILTQDI